MIKSKTMSLLPPYSSWSILCDLVIGEINSPELHESTCVIRFCSPLSVSLITLFLCTLDTSHYEHTQKTLTFTLCSLNGYIHTHMEPQTCASKRPSYLLNTPCRSEKRREIVKCQSKSS